jgi:hypothetical protein
MAPYNFLWKQHVPIYNLYRLILLQQMFKQPPLNEDQANYDEDYAKSKVENPKEENNKTQR